MRKRVLYLSVTVIAVVVFAFAGCDMFGNDGDNTTEENNTNVGDDTSEDDSITFSGSISDVTTRSFTNKDGINTKSETGDLEIVVIYDPQKSW